MFEKSRRRIVAAIMAILIFLCLGSLIAIYTFSTNETSKEYYAMLEHYALEYDADEQLYENKMERQDFKSKDISEKEAVFQLSTFSAVVLSKEGEILFVDADKKSSYPPLSTVSQMIKYALKNK